MFHRQRVKRHKEKLGWNNASAQQTAVSKVTVQRHGDRELTFVSGLDHCNVLVIQRGITTNIKHVCSSRITIIINFQTGSIVAPEAPKTRDFLKT